MRLNPLEIIKFVSLDGKHLLSLSLDGATITEIKETKALLAYENNLPIENIFVSLEQ